MASRKDARGRVLHKGESQRKDGRYQYRYIDTNNERITIYAMDLNSLRNMEKEIEKKHFMGLDYSSENISLLDQIDLMLDMKTNIKNSTLRTYRKLLPIIERHGLGAKSIAKISMMDVKIFCSELSKQGYAYSTIQKVRSLVKEALKLAYEDNVLWRNPCDFKLSSIIKNDATKVAALTNEQKAELLSFLKKDKYYKKYYDLFVFLLSVGVRISEYCGITIDNIDFDKNEVHIEKQLLEGEEGLHITDLKTYKADRTIPLTPEALVSIRNIINSRSVKHEFQIGDYSGFISLNRQGNPRHGREIDNIFKRIEKRYNVNAIHPIPRLTPHVLRHTFCTNFIASGGSIKAAQYLMGHAFASTTMDTYTDHVMDTVRADMSIFPPQTNEE